MIDDDDRESGKKVAQCQCKQNNWGRETQTNDIILGQIKKNTS